MSKKKVTMRTDTVEVSKFVNRLIYDVIWAEDGVSTPIIACSFTGSTSQYSTVAIPYIVYNPASLTANITLAVNGVQVSQQTVDRTQQTWNYKATTAGTRATAFTFED